MDRPSIPRATFAVAFQLCVAAFVLTLLVVSPPPSGPYLLVPLDRTALRAMARVAVANGAALVAPGALPGTLIVAGERARLLGPLRAAHVLLLAGVAGGCAGREEGAPL